MRFKNKLLTFSVLSSLLLQTSLYAGHLFPNMPDDVENEIISRTKIIDSRSASLVSRSWKQKFNEEAVWKEYAERIPGHREIEYTQQTELKDLQGAARSKRLIQLLMEPGFKIIAMNRGIDATAVSGDGETTIGWTKKNDTDQDETFVYSMRSGFRVLPSPDNDISFYPSDCNNDGEVIIAWGLTLAGLCKSHIYLEENRLMPFKKLNNKEGYNITSMSADLKTCVGTFQDTADSEDKAFTYTEEQNLFFIGTLNGGINISATGVSANGKVVVGEAADGAANNESRGFIYTQEDGLISVGTLNGGNSSSANAVSANGKVVIGEAADGAANNETRGFIYTQEDGLISLGILNKIGKNSAFIYSEKDGYMPLKNLNDIYMSSAKAVSANGDVVVGISSDNSSKRGSSAFIYYLKKKGKMLSLEDVLQTMLQGANLINANDVSADGTIVVGSGKTDQNISFAWRAYIPRYDIFENEGFKLLKN